MGFVFLAMVMVCILGIVCLKATLGSANPEAPAASAASWTCDTCGEINPPESDTCATCGMEKEA